MGRNVYDDWNEDGTLPKIKPCPFCGGTGILSDNGYEDPVIDMETGAYVDMDIFEGDRFWCECPECGAILPGASTPKEAIEQWNRRNEPPNDPLTMEQLREMDGEPVWVVQPGYKSSYGLVRTTWTVTMLVFNNGRFVAAEFAILEKGCKIFRRKPEEGTT